MRNLELETVSCHLHSRDQPRYPRFKLCPMCLEDARQESVVVQAVVNYFSTPEFRKLFIHTEYPIQIGSYNSRADIVIFDELKYLVAIVECKRPGIAFDDGSGIKQLKSYLAAGDIQFGVFANDTRPGAWTFYENLRGHSFHSVQHLKSIQRAQFEREITANLPIESIRQEKERLLREAEQKSLEVQSSDRELQNVNQQIQYRKRQSAELKNERDLLTKETTSLKETIDRYKLKKEVLEGLKLKSTRNNLKKENESLETDNTRLKDEVKKLKQEYKNLSGDIDSLTQDRNKLDKNINKKEKELESINSQLRNKQGEWKNFRNMISSLKKRITYLQTQEENLQKSIKDKINRIRDVNRMSWLEEIEEVFYGQFQEGLVLLQDLGANISEKQRLVKQEQEMYAAYERNRVEINKKKLQLAKVTEERASTLKRLRIVMRQLKAFHLEEDEKERTQLVQTLWDARPITEKLKTEINKLQEGERELEIQITKNVALNWCADEEIPTYIRIQTEIDRLKAEKSDIETEIGLRVFTLLIAKEKEWMEIS